MEKDSIQDKLDYLQFRILAAVNEFENSAGLKVASVDIIREDVTKFCGPTNMVHAVVVKITL